MVKNGLETAKALFGMAKQVPIVTILLCPVVHPAGIGHALDRACVTEGGLRGFSPTGG